jgi:acetone carboxylase alpha subunit
MNDKLSAEAVLEDQELIKKFLKETTLFLGPDQEIMQSHDIMPITDNNEYSLKEISTNEE